MNLMHGIELKIIAEKMNGASGAELKPIVAVPAFICADAFNKFFSFCTGFVAGCMIWMVIAEALPDAFKETSSSQVVSAATLSVAFMEALGYVFQDFSNNYKSEDDSGFAISLLFGLGPLLGGLVLVEFVVACEISGMQC